MSARNLNDMTQQEIERLIFADCSSSKLVALSDVLSSEEIYTLPSHPSFDQFSPSFRSWIWNAIECLLDDAYGPLCR